MSNSIAVFPFWFAIGTALILALPVTTVIIAGALPSTAFAAPTGPRGLTAVDATLALRAQGRCQIYMLSRRGLVPHVHNTATQPADPPPFRDPENLLSIFRELRAMVGTLRESDRCWRAAIDSLRPASNEMWSKLPPADQRRFVRHLKTLWEAHRHRMAPQVAQKVKQYREDGTLQVIAGRLPL